MCGRREIQILYHLKGHENVVHIKEHFEDTQYVHIIMEVRRQPPLLRARADTAPSLACHARCITVTVTLPPHRHATVCLDVCAQLASGGELFDRIVARGHYSEKDAAAAFRTMVQVINHCHTMGVMHRDLKVRRRGHSGCGVGRAGGCPVCSRAAAWRLCPASHLRDMSHQGHHALLVLRLSPQPENFLLTDKTDNAVLKVRQERALGDVWSGRGAGGTQHVRRVPGPRPLRVHTRPLRRRTLA